MWRKEVCAVGEEAEVKREAAEFCYGGIGTESGCDSWERRGFMGDWEEMGGGCEEVGKLR